MEAYEEEKRKRRLKSHPKPVSKEEDDEYNTPPTDVNVLLGKVNYTH